MERPPSAVARDLPREAAQCHQRGREDLVQHPEQAYGNRIKLKQHDAETDKVLERADQIKGYQYEKNRYITITDDDLDAIQVEGSRVIDIERFVNRSEIDQLYWDLPYYLEPDGPIATEAFAVIREAIRR